MGEIYLKASRVLVWLGPADADAYVPALFGRLRALRVFEDAAMYYPRLAEALESVMSQRKLVPPAEPPVLISRH
jgi:hypothetical protein